MKPTLFYLRIFNDAEEDFFIPYQSIEDCLDDKSLNVLFKNNYMSHVYQNDQRISGRTITNTDTLRDILISNSTLILHPLRRSK